MEFNFFTYLRGREKKGGEEEKERQTSPTLIHSPIDHKGPGIKYRSPTWMVETQVLNPSSASSQGVP